MTRKIPWWLLALATVAIVVGSTIVSCLTGSAESGTLGGAAAIPAWTPEGANQEDPDQAGDPAPGEGRE